LKLGREPSINRCAFHLERYRWCSHWRHQDDFSAAASSQWDDRASRRQLQVLQQIWPGQDLFRV